MSWQRKWSSLLTVSLVCAFCSVRSVAADFVQLKPMDFEIDGRRCAFSPNSSVFVTCGRVDESARSDKVIVWDAKTGKERHAIRLEKTTDGHRPVFSPNGRDLLLLTHSNVFVWDHQEPKLRFKFPKERGEPVAFSPTGRFLAVKNNDIRVYDLDNGKAVAKIPEPDTGDGYAFASDTTLVLSADDYDIAVWKIGSEKPQALIRDLDRKFEEWTLLPNKKQVATRVEKSGKSFVQIWDLSTLKKLSESQLPQLMSYLDMAGDGATIVKKSGSDISLFDIRSAKFTENLFTSNRRRPGRLLVGKSSFLTERYFATTAYSGQSSSVMGTVLLLVNRRSKKVYETQLAPPQKGWGILGLPSVLISPDSNYLALLPAGRFKEAFLLPLSQLE